MPTILPIDGSVYYAFPMTGTSRLALGAGAPTSGASRESATVRDSVTRPTKMSLGAGTAQRQASRLALTVGTSANNHGVSRLALDTNGLRRSRHSRMFLTVAPDKSKYPARLTLDVVSSRTSSGRSAMLVSVRGGAATRSLRQTMSIRGGVQNASEMALIVSTLARSASRQGLDAGKVLTSPARIAVDVAQSFGFTTLIDIIGPALDNQPTGGVYPAQDITGRLYVGGVEVAIKAFDYQEPKGRLGSLLNVTLADAVRTLAPTNSSIRFDLVVTVGGVEHVKTLIDTGKVAGRGYTISWSGSGPGDELTIAGLDTLADKFSLAPRAPIVMFDPAYVNPSSVEVRPRDAIVTERGQVILPTLEPVAGLTMMAALRRAYTASNGFAFMTHLDPAILALLARVNTLIGGEGSRYGVGLGFDNVITNIPDYPISRADFSIESSWHDAVQGLVGMYGPVYFVEGNDLFIVDVFRALPAGHIPRTIGISEYARLGYEQPYRDPYNAVILSYQQRGPDFFDDWAYRDKTEQTVEDNGGFGTAGYQRVETYTRTRQKYLLSDPTNVLDEQVVEHDVRVYGYALVPVPLGGEDWGLAPGSIIQVSREVQQDRYGADGLKVGHHKEIFGLVNRAAHFGIGSSVDPILIASEDCTITWVQHPDDPTQMIQALNFTMYEGLVYESERTETRDGEEVRVRYPVLAAQSSPGVIKDDGRMFYGPIRSVTEKLRRVRGNQLDVMVTERDLAWSGTTRESYTAPRTGSRSSNPFEARQRTILLRDLDSEAAIGPRVPFSVSAGELQRDRALELGHRYLRQGINQPAQPQMALPSVDFAVHQGSVVRGEFRDGTLTTPMIVEGLSITGQNLGVAGQHRIQMSLEGTELQA